MAAIPRISETQRQAQLVAGQLNNNFVRASEYNKLVDRVNSVTTENGAVSISGNETVGGNLAVTGATTTATFQATSTSDFVGTVTAATINERSGGSGISIENVLLRDGYAVSRTTPLAVNVTGSLTAAQMATGVVTSTSAAAVAITTPTATNLSAQLGITGAGGYFDFIIDNSAGANTVTLTLDASIAVVTPAITGGATLTVSTANAVGVFRIYFTSATTAKCFRIA